jgi:hypothetical protein
MTTTSQKRAAALKLRTRIKLDEAPYIVTDAIGGLYADALALIKEAADNDTLPTDKAYETNQWTGTTLKEIDAEKSTVAVSDLMKWLEPLLATISISGTPQNLDNAINNQANATTTHRIENRKNALSAVIKKAEENAIDPNDKHSHWAAFVALAESKDRPSPLLGYIEEEGVKYQSGDGETKFLTQKNFFDRIARVMRQNSLRLATTR